MNDLDVILIIYEYLDYIKGFGVFVWKYKFFIYVNVKMWKVMDNMIGEVFLD